MSKKLNMVLATLLTFSLITPTAFADETPVSDETQPSENTQTEESVLTTEGNNENSTTVSEVSDDTETQLDTEEPKAEVVLGGLPSSSQGEAPEGIFNAEQSFYDETDVTVDKTTSPYKDGIYLELRYTSVGHIPSFKVALIDSEGKGLGEVEANESNFDKDLKMYKLVIPHNKPINYGDNIGIYVYNFDGSVKNITFKRTIPLKSGGEGDDLEVTYVEEEVPLENENYFFYKMGYALVENENQEIEKHYTFSAFNPLEGWIETDSNLFAFKFKTETGTLVKNTSFTLEEIRNGNKVTITTDAHGMAYLSPDKFKGKVAKLVSDQYELADDLDTLSVSFPEQTDRTVVKIVKVQPKKTKDSAQSGLANISITQSGDTTLSKEWLNATLEFKSATSTYTFDISHNDIKNGLQATLPNGTYQIKATSQHGLVTLPQESITVKDNTVNLPITIAPKYVLEISKDGSQYSYKFINVTNLTDKVFSGTTPQVYGVVPNQSFMVQDQEDQKFYTVFINPDYTTTKLVLGVGTVFGGEVSTPHTGDNIIFLVALFLLSLVIAGIGFYFHKTGKRVKNIAVSAGLIGVLILSTTPINIAQAFTVIIDGSGSGQGKGGSGSYTYSSRGTVQVHSSASLLMTNLLPAQHNMEYAYYFDPEIFDKYRVFSPDYLLHPYHLNTALFWATNEDQYKKALDGSFMIFDYEKGGLRPIWGTKNAVLGTLTESQVNENRKEFGIKDTQFQSRLLTYLEKGSLKGGTNYMNDLDYYINALGQQLGGVGATRQLWTGKDINGVMSSSKKQIGDVLSPEKTEDFIVKKFKKYFPEHELEEGIPIDLISKLYLNALSGKISDNVYIDLKEGVLPLAAPKTLGPHLLTEAQMPQAVETGRVASYMITYQNVHGVYIAGKSQKHMAYMPVVEIGEWFDYEMRKVSAGYRKLNILPSETARMLYDPKVAHGTLNKKSWGIAPTQTFHGNIEGTTGKSLMPVSHLIKARANNSPKELAQNPYAGWGYMFFSSYGGYACAECETKDKVGIYSWLNLHVDNEDGTTKTEKIPWGLDNWVKGKTDNFLNLSTSNAGSMYYTLSNPFIYDGVKYTIKSTDENKQSKLTLIDRTTKESLFKGYSGTIKLENKYSSLYDNGAYYLHKDEKAEPYKLVDATGTSVTLDYDYLPSLKVIEAGLSPDPEFKKRVDQIKDYIEGTGIPYTMEDPIEGSGFMYPREPYYTELGWNLGEHFSQADLTLDLYVEAECIDATKCVLPVKTPTKATGTHTVPEWRLSKYFNDSTPNSKSDSYIDFKTPGSTWRNPSINHSGNTKFNLSTSDLTTVPWMESKAKMFNGDTQNRSVSAYGNSFTFQVGGDLLAIKDNSTVTNSKLASWKNDYSILNNKVGATATGSPEPNNKASITKKHTVNYLVRSPYTDYKYYETRTRSYSCTDYWGYPDTCYEDYTWSGNASMNYTYDSTNDISVVFKRYNPKNNAKLSNFAKKTDNSQNGFYWESYQDNQSLKVNPEVAMVYDDNSGNTTVVQTAGDILREIKPVHYNSINFSNINVIPKVDGMSVATDNEAKQLANRLGASRLNVIYKGASTSVSYEVSGEIELRTYALDIGSTALRNTWGNSTYSTEKVRDEFLTRHATQETDGTWTIKPTAKGNYVINGKDYGGVSEIKNVQQKNQRTIEHTLVVRGGQLISVNGNTNLSSLDPKLKDAIERMNISTPRGSNVFNQFEYNKGENLTEANVANLFNLTRGTNAHAVGQPWYNEDTTTLVVREYVTTYDLPPHVYVDKIPQEVPGIATPMDKAQFFKQGYLGFTKLRFQLVDGWMEFDSSKPSPFGGVYTPLYVVPNVSVTDTTQF